MAVIWVDIWDAQSSMKAKGLINRYFNIGSYITTICGMNMNLEVLECKNCWKWGHTTFTCCTHGSKYVKCNSTTKSSTTNILLSTAKWTLRLTYLDSKLNRVNLALTVSSASTAKTITKLTTLSIFSGNIVSKKNGTQKNTKSFVTIGTPKSTYIHQYSTHPFTFLSKKGCFWLQRH